MLNGMQNFDELTSDFSFSIIDAYIFLSIIPFFSRYLMLLQSVTEVTYVRHCCIITKYYCPLFVLLNNSELVCNAFDLRRT